MHTGMRCAPCCYCSCAGLEHARPGNTVLSFHFFKVHDNRPGGISIGCLLRVNNAAD